jgi:hypothetical protein
LNYKEALFRLLDEKAENIPLQKQEDAEYNTDAIFDILESLEDPEEAAKDWVARRIDDFASEDAPFIAKGIRFLRKEAFKESEAPPEKSETSTEPHGETSSH